MKRLFLAAVPFLFLAPRLPAQSSCSPEAQTKAAREVARWQNQALAYKGLAMDANVPKTLRPAIQHFKQGLAEAADTVVACYPANVSPQTIATKLAGLLHANQPASNLGSAPGPSDDDIDKPIDHLFADQLTVQATLVSSQPRILQIVTKSSVPCGDDAQILLYEPKDNTWRRALRWSSELRPSGQAWVGDSGAFGDFFVSAILQGPSENEWRAVVAHGTPWCTSRFSAFAIDILAPSANPDTPHIVWHTRRGYSRGDFAPRLRVLAPQTFEFRNHAIEIDPNEYERGVVYRFRLDGDKVTRLSPFAINSRGFVTEWLEADWKESLLVSDPENLPQLSAAHQRYAERFKSKDSKDWVGYTYGPVWACHDSSKHFQIEVDSDGPKGKQGGYYQVSENGSGYTMMIAGSPNRDIRCEGPDLMPPH